LQFPRLVPLSTQGTWYQYPGAMTTTRGRPHHRSLLTFYQSSLRRHSFSAWRRGFGLREGSGLLDSKRWVLYSCCCARFISFPGQISRLPAQYKIGGQPSKFTKL
jgi:hypothetical protein